MKKLYAFIMLSCLLLPAGLFAQSMQTIEADLLKSFKKIYYWDQQRQNGKVEASDSLGEANNRFGNKLKNYTEKYPATINEQFKTLRKEHLNIFTSADGLFRIYSWETWEGGTMHDFTNVFQYKNGPQAKCVLLTSTEETYIPFYSNLYTLKNGYKTYYLGVYCCIYSTRDAGTGVKIFDIENGKLNDDVKLIKTSSGVHSKIYYDYNFFSVVDIKYELRPTITFDPLTKTIHIPLVAADGKVTRKYITYKLPANILKR